MKYCKASRNTDAELAVVLDCLLIVLLDIIREVVDRDVVMLDIFHNLGRYSSEQLLPFPKTQVTYPLLEAPQLGWSQGVSLANDRNDINTRGEAAHKLDVHFPQPNNAKS